MTDNSILLEPSLKPRDGWEADYRQCHDQGDDELLIPDTRDVDLWNVRLDPQTIAILKSTLREFLMEYCIE